MFGFGSTGISQAQLLALLELQPGPPAPILPAIYKTGVIDFLAVAAAHDVAMPLVAGKIFRFISGRLVILTRNAAQVTTLVYRYAQNGVAIDNAAQVADIANSQAAPMSQRTAASGILEVSMTTFPLQMLVTVPAVGVGLTDFTGFLEIVGYYR